MEHLRHETLVGALSDDFFVVIQTSFQGEKSFNGNFKLTSLL